MNSVVRVGGQHPLHGAKMPKQALSDFVYRLSFCFRDGLDTEMATDAGDSEGELAGEDDGARNTFLKASAPGKANKRGPRSTTGATAAQAAAGSSRSSRNPDIGPIADEPRLALKPVASGEALAAVLGRLLGSPHHHIHRLCLRRAALQRLGFRCSAWRRWACSFGQCGATRTTREPLAKRMVCSRSRCNRSVVGMRRWLASKWNRQKPSVSSTRTEQARREWNLWQGRQSDLDGCTTMHSPSALRPRMRLSDAAIPVLALIDALHANGWKPEDCVMVHGSGKAKQYDGRFMLRSRSYLQCILALPEPLAAGIKEFKSGLPSVFYALMLRTKRLPQAKLSAKEYQRQLAKCDGDHVAMAILDRAATPEDARVLPHKLLKGSVPASVMGVQTAATTTTTWHRRGARRTEAWLAAPKMTHKKP